MKAFVTVVLLLAVTMFASCHVERDSISLQEGSVGTSNFKKTGGGYCRTSNYAYVVISAAFEKDKSASDRERYMLIAVRLDERAIGSGNRLANGFVLMTGPIQNSPHVLKIDGALLSVELAGGRATIGGSAPLVAELETRRTAVTGSAPDATLGFRSVAVETVSAQQLLASLPKGPGSMAELVDEWTRDLRASQQ